MKLTERIAEKLYQLARAVLHPGRKRAAHVVVIDCVFFQMGSSGIARVWESLLREWSTSGFRDHLIILDRAKSAPRFSGLTYLDVPPLDYQNLEQDRIMLQRVCDSVNAAVFCSSYYTIPLTTRSVFMLYDMIPEVLASLGKWNLDQPMWQAKAAALRHAARFISISDNSAADLQRFVPWVGPEQITVAHCGCDFVPPPATARQAFLDKYAITRPYFMMAGGRAGYKNSALFFSAFAQLGAQRSAYAIVCCGGEIELDAASAALAADAPVHMLRLDDAELQCAYAAAQALVFPSVYEGFGMPVIEAMACGCPVITCPTGSLPEVAGDAALFVEPTDVAGMLAALQQTGIAAEREWLVAAGCQRATLFSWQKMAAIIQRTLLEATPSS